MKRFPVTNRQYITFLDDLVATGREEEAQRHVPRKKGGTVGELGAMIYGRDDHGRFFLRPDAEGDVWEPEMPALMIDWFGALSYSRWWAARTGQSWRLPGELAWEKAARGVDGRFYPWGDRMDPSWCCMRDSHQRKPLPAVVDTFPTDESPFGLRGMGGNVRDWCADIFTNDGPKAANDAVQFENITREASAMRRTLRGGAWGNGARYARASNRSRLAPAYRHTLFGLRLARVLAREHT